MSARVVAQGRFGGFGCLAGAGRAGRAAGLAAACLALSTAVLAYPLDAYEATGIRRLEGLRLAQLGQVKDVKQPPGAVLNLAQVTPRLVGQTFDLPPPDAAFTARINAVLTGNMGDYGVAVLDLSDPAKPLYAEHRADHLQNVGSVGKLVVALALFQALADLYPDDLDARRKILKTTVVTADSFSQSDHHTVRIFDPASKTLTRRQVRIGDQATLYEWLDWMLSPSSNSAAGMVMREVMLMRHFGKAYPASEAENQRFFNETSKAELSKLYAADFHEPVTRNGLDIERLRQGSFFTAGGKARVPGAGDSYGTARELARYLLRMEQGRLVDLFSSTEIKRLIYLTELRIRYASSPALAGAALYFKSGSLYQCAPEAGFSCKPYAGNVKNYMNSATVVESPADGRQVFYISTLVTNILRKNSAGEHQALATRLHGVLTTGR